MIMESDSILFMLVGIGIGILIVLPLAYFLFNQPKGIMLLRDKDGSVIGIVPVNQGG